MQHTTMPNYSLIHEKLDQAVGILDELKVDCWLTFVRETSAVLDPVLPFIYGHDVTWQSAFLLTRAGRRIAILGRFDAENAHRLGAYDEVIAYDAAFSEPLRKVLADLEPQQIALNYSTNDSHADGLTHGLFLLLHEYLRGTPFPDRFVSAERIVTRAARPQDAGRGRTHQDGDRHDLRHLSARLCRCGGGQRGT